MKTMKKTLAILLTVLIVCSVGIIAFAAESNTVTYSVTWVYEDHTDVDQYAEGESITVPEAILSDGSTGAWATDKDAEKAPILSPVPKTMPAQSLTFYAKKSFASDAVDHVIDHVIDQVDQIVEQQLSKEYWKNRLPLLWVFPYVWYHLVYFFTNLFA